MELLVLHMSLVPICFPRLGRSQAAGCPPGSPLCSSKHRAAHGAGVCKRSSLSGTTDCASRSPTLKTSVHGYFPVSLLLRVDSKSSITLHHDLRAERWSIALCCRRAERSSPHWEVEPRARALQKSRSPRMRIVLRKEADRSGQEQPFPLHSVNSHVSVCARASV